MTLSGVNTNLFPGFAGSDFKIWFATTPPDARNCTLLATAQMGNHPDPNWVSRTLTINVYRTVAGSHLAVVLYTTKWADEERPRWITLCGDPADCPNGAILSVQDLLARLDGDHTLEVCCLGFHRRRGSNSKPESEIWGNNVAEVHLMWQKATSAIFDSLGYIRQSN